jgi:hypothetical protein
MGEIDLTDMYKVFHPAAADYTFFSAAHRIFSKIDHILSCKANLNKYKSENNPLYPNRPQGDKIRNQWQGKSQNHSNSQRWNDALLNN